MAEGAPVAEDTSSWRGLLTVLAGRAGTLRVDPDQHAFLKFSPETLPQISAAELKCWSVRRKAAAGYPAELELELSSAGGGQFSLKCAHPLMVERRDDADNLIGYSMSDGSRLTLVREQPQTIQPANQWTDVIWSSVQSGDGAEAGGHSNYTPDGRWKCILAGRYRFKFTLSKADPKGGRFSVKLTERLNGAVIRDYLIDTMAPGNDGLPLTDSTAVNCSTGYTYALSVLGEGTSAVTVGGGAAPSSGQPLSRLSISPD